MMPRRSRRLAPLALALSALPFLAAGVVAGALLAACQDYNFSPVNYCLIQPGTERVTLSDISTADVLFVVDDSGSMEGEQTKLAASFDAFVNALATTNLNRVQVQLEPIDFHIAITSTSVFLNAPTTATCSSACAGAAGTLTCCDPTSKQPLKVAKTCPTAGVQGPCAASNTCRADCQGHAGELTCCQAANAAPETLNQTCPVAGAACGSVQDRYVVPRRPVLCGEGCNGGAGFTCKTTCLGLSGQSACCDAANVPQRVATCKLGIGTEGGLYPRGDFVHAGSNPRVLHFTKDLFCTRNVGGTACTDTVPKTAAINDLIAKFKANILVGTCGSGQEMGLEASRRAIRKALKQDGLSQPADVQAGEWPHDKSKLVVVFVGDEDDCSTAEDGSTGVIMTLPPATEACQADGALPADQQKRFKLTEYADFLSGLSRPVAGAFIVSATANTCVDSACQAGICSDATCTEDPAVCGGQAPGVRFLDLSRLLAAKGADTVAGSVCAPGDFSAALQRVAEVVKQPLGLQLPTQPANPKLTLLRIAGADGKTRKTCFGPAPDAGLAPGASAAQITAAVAAAKAAGYDWWFTGGDDTNQAPTGPSRFVYLNQATQNCIANPGETYSADYLGLMPAGGCASALDCQATLGGAIEDWTCDTSGGGARGTCLCGSGP